MVIAGCSGEPRLREEWSAIRLSSSLHSLAFAILTPLAKVVWDYWAPSGRG
jgi:hypothetical protein